MSGNESSKHKRKRKRGGQPGNVNAVRHGYYSREGRRRFQEMDALIRDCYELLNRLVDGDCGNPASPDSSDSFNNTY
jgi:hypothetical protein